MEKKKPLINKEKYRELLKDERWKKLRLEIVKRDKYSCVRCGKRGCELQVHHKIYINGKKPWEYIEEYLETLCGDCHKKTHKLFSIEVFNPDELVDIREKNKVKKQNKPKKEKLPNWKKKEKDFLNEINSIKTRELFIQKISNIYFSLPKEKNKKEKMLFKLRRLRRFYVNIYGKNYQGIPIEIIEKLFLVWDEAAP